jgi:hypothetical protein
MEISHQISPRSCRGVCHEGRRKRPPNPNYSCLKAKEKPFPPKMTQFVSFICEKIIQGKKDSFISFLKRCLQNFCVERRNIET